MEREGEEYRQLARDRRGQSLGCNDNNNNLCCSIRLMPVLLIQQLPPLLFRLHCQQLRMLCRCLGPQGGVYLGPGLIVGGALQQKVVGSFCSLLAAWAQLSGALCCSCLALAPLGMHGIQMCSLHAQLQPWVAWVSEANTGGRLRISCEQVLRCRELVQCLGLDSGFLACLLASHGGCRALGGPHSGWPWVAGSGRCIDLACVSVQAFGRVRNFHVCKDNLDQHRPICMTMGVQAYVPRAYVPVRSNR